MIFLFFWPASRSSNRLFWLTRPSRRIASLILVAPGFIATDMSAAALQKYPNRSVGKPEDVAEVVAMLCLLHSAYLSGAVIEIGGGA